MLTFPCMHSQSVTFTHTIKWTRTRWKWAAMEQKVKDDKGLSFFVYTCCRVWCGDRGCSKMCQLMDWMNQVAAPNLPFTTLRSILKILWGGKKVALTCTGPFSARICQGRKVSGGIPFRGASSRAVILMHARWHDMVFYNLKEDFTLKWKFRHYPLTPMLMEGKVKFHSPLKTEHSPKQLKQNRNIKKKIGSIQLVRCSPSPWKPKDHKTDLKWRNLKVF